MKTATAKISPLRGHLDRRAARPGANAPDREGLRLRHELDSLTDLAKTGELMGPVLHEVNNFVNAMLLQLSVLASKSPEFARADLMAIREQAVGLTAVLEQLRNYRKRRQRTCRRVDLHRTIWRTIYEMNRDEVERNGKPLFLPTDSTQGARRPSAGTGSIPAFLKLAPESPIVNDSAMDLRNLCAFLLNHAAGVATVGGSVSIRTIMSDGQVRLGVEDTGPNLDSAMLPQIFEPSVLSREGATSLELAACKGLVAKLGGRIAARNLPVRGVSIWVELPLAPESSPGLIAKPFRQ